MSKLEPSQHIINQYLMAQLTSKEQALTVAHTDSPELFTAAAQDFLKISRLVQGWHSIPPKPSTNRHYGKQILSLLQHKKFSVIRSRRLPGLEGDESLQINLIEHVLAAAIMKSPPSVLFRKRGEQLDINISGLTLPEAHQVLFAQSQPLQYLIHNLSRDNLSAYILLRDCQRTGFRPYVNPRHPQKLQLRFVCLEQLHLPF